MSQDKHHNELEQHEVKQVLAFLTQYGKKIGIGALAITVAIVASRGIAQRHANQMAQAEELLAAAQTPQQFEEIITQYSSTAAAPVALLSLAKTQFNNGDYFQARAQYESFLKKYKSSDLCPMAEFGLASCTEADGDFDGAAQQFSAFVDAQPDHYLNPIATLGLARSLQQAERTDEARIVLENFLVQTTASQWINQAQAMLDDMAN